MDENDLSLNRLLQDALFTDCSQTHQGAQVQARCRCGTNQSPVNLTERKHDADGLMWAVKGQFSCDQTEKDKHLALYFIALICIFMTFLGTPTFTECRQEPRPTQTLCT